MKNVQVKQAAQQAEARLKKHHDGKGAMGKPPVPKREGVSHGPVGIGPTTKRKPTR
jgi:hypothetical protein